jgi:hypothetical protein
MRHLCILEQFTMKGRKTVNSRFAERFSRNRRALSSDLVMCGLQGVGSDVHKIFYVDDNEVLCSVSFTKL